MSEIITKAEAKTRGLKRYFTGGMCKHGHVSERYVINCTCVECHYQLTHAWRKANPGKVIAWAIRWQDAHPERVREARRRRYKNDPSLDLERNRRWRKEHAKTIKPRRRKHYAQNREHRLALAAEYRAKNREKINAYFRFRARKIYDLIAVLRQESPDLLKEFGL